MFKKILFIVALGLSLNGGLFAQNAPNPSETPRAEVVSSDSKEKQENVVAVQSTANDEIARNAAAAEAADRFNNLEKLREALIVEKARSLKFLKPTDALSLVPTTIITENAIEFFLKQKVKEMPALVQLPNFCSGSYSGERYTFDVPTQVKLGTLLNDLRLRFGINFIPDAELVDTPIQVSANDVPWNLLLRSQLDLLDIQATCLDDTTIQLIKRQKLLTLQDSQRKTAPVKTEYIKLKFLRASAQGPVNLAGRPAGGAATIESLENEITKVLRAGGDARGSVGRIPGTSELIITATEAQISQIREIIEKADRPSYRVQVFGLVYTINENKLRDVGSQLSAIVGTGNLNRLGGVSTQPLTSGGGSTGGTAVVPGGLNPGGVRNLGPGFNLPNGSLAASGSNTIIGGSAIIGTAQFSYQLSLLEQLGIARRVEKLRIETKDGTTGTFESGRQIPVIVQAANNLGGGAPGQLEFINAGSTLEATPQIIEDPNGKPYLINLAFRAESNNVDTSIQTTGGVPSVNGRRVQSETTFLLNQVYVLAASNDTTESANISRAPGLGRIPLLGELFKRRVRTKSEDKLYFAFWVEVSYSDSISTIPTNNLDTTFLPPPPSTEPLKVNDKKK